MSGQEQQEVLQQYKESGQISHKEIRNMKEDKAEQQGKSEADTESPKADEEQITANEEYQTPHPQGITSLCYSCQKYSDCNVKTGTCNCALGHKYFGVLGRLLRRRLRLLFGSRVLLFGFYFQIGLIS